MLDMHEILALPCPSWIPAHVPLAERISPLFFEEPIVELFARLLFALLL